MRPLPLLLAVSLAACTAAPERAPAIKAPPAQAIGPAASCIDTTLIRDSQVWDDYTIDFHMAGGQTYRNTLPHGCPELGFEERFGYTITTNRLCSVDIIHVLHSEGSPGASCGLGEFVPVQVARPPRR